MIEPLLETVIRYNQPSGNITPASPPVQPHQNIVTSMKSFLSFLNVREFSPFPASLMKKNPPSQESLWGIFDVHFHVYTFKYPLP